LRNRLAGLSGYIAAQEHGLETMVGKGGLKISGGQLQRIAIARAILRKSKIYIFDEVTSILDPQTELEFQKGFEEIYQLEQLL